MFSKRIILKTIFTVCFAILLGGCGPSLAPRAKIMFKGQEIRDNIQTGLIATPLENKVFFSIGSPYHDFIFLLPYSQSWELESGKKLPLWAKDNKYIASVNIGTLSAKFPLLYYQKILQNLNKSGQYIVQRAEILGLSKGNKMVLRYQAKSATAPKNLENLNLFTWNYWVALPYGSTWYDLHLSVISKDEENLPHEEKKIFSALASFSPGYYSQRW